MSRQARRYLEVLCGGCRFCGEKEYSVLDEHHIQMQSLGGPDTEHNRMIVCANCHRKIHAGLIVVDGWYFTSSGWKIHCWVDSEERYL